MSQQISVISSRNQLMQQLMDGVRHGYTLFTNGSIRPDQLVKMIRKFSVVYQIDEDRNGRYRRRRNGLGNAKLFLFYRDDLIYWWLLVSPFEKGEHAAHALEKLHDVFGKGKRIEIDGYELVRMPRNTKDHRKKESDEDRLAHEINKCGAKVLSKNIEMRPVSRLTWRMTKNKEKEWRDSIIEAVRKHSNTSLHRLVYKLWSSPGFGGIRSQIGKLAALYRAEVKRNRRSDAPKLPQKLPYLRRLKITGMTIGEYNSFQKSKVVNGTDENTKHAEEQEKNDSFE